MKDRVNVVLIALSSPILVGLYSAQTGEMVKSFESNQMSSDYIPELFDSLLKHYKIESVVYSRGPGSYMSIKVAYLFLQTLNISKGIKIMASEGFAFNNNSPIKAMGRLYFFKENGVIITKEILENQIIGPLELPKQFYADRYSDDISPLYVLPAV